MTPIEEENACVRQELDFDKIFEFQKTHCTDIIQGCDNQYDLWIDGKLHYKSLTPLYALVFGIEKFKQENYK